MNKKILIICKEFTGKTTKGQLVIQDWGVQFTGSIGESMSDIAFCEGSFSIPWSTILYIRESFEE